MEDGFRDHSTRLPDGGVDFESILEHTSWIRGLARNLVIDQSSVDDLVQQAWLAALQAPPREPAAIRSWLRSVVRNLAFRSYRDRGRREQHEPGAARDEAVESAADLCERVDLERQVVDAARELDEPYRETVLLRFFKDLTPNEIARRQGIPAATVRGRLKRGLDQLRERLDREHGDRTAWCLALVPIARLHPVPPASAAGSAWTATQPWAAAILGLGGWIMTTKKLAIVLAVGIAMTAGIVYVSSPAAESPSDRLASVIDSNPGGSAGSPNPDKDITGVTTPAAPPPLSGAVSTTGVHGRLVDRVGEPLAGITIARSASGVFGFLPERRVESRDDGTFTMPVASVKRDFVLRIRPSRGPEQSVPVKALSPGEDRNLGDLLVFSTRSLSGHVFDREGLPVIGARVSVRVDADGVRESMDIVESDANGEFTLVGLESHALAVQCVADGFEIGDPLMISSGTDPVEELTFTLTPSRTIEGRVVWSDGTPIPDVTVSIAQRDLAPYLHVGPVTDANGRFRSDTGLPPGRVVVRVIGRGLPSVSLELDDIDQLPSVIEIPRPSSLVVRVNADGEPVPRVGFRLTHEGGGGPFSNAKDIADSQFTLENLSPGEHTIRVWSDDRRSDDTSVVIAEGTRHEITIDLALATVVHVTLRDREGELVREARAIVVPSETLYRREHAVTTGTFASWRLAEPGTQLYVEAPGYAPFMGPDVESLVVDERIDITLEPECGVEFTVVDDAGEPVDGAVVTYSSRDDRAISRWQRNRYDPYQPRPAAPRTVDGHVSLRGLPAGAFTFALRFGGEIVASFSLDLDRVIERTITIATTEEFEIKGHVLLNGKPAVGGHLKFYRGKPDYRTTAGADDQGRFQATLRPGSYWISYVTRPNSNYGMSVQRRIQPGDDLTLRFEPAPFRLRCRRDDGEPVVGLEVHLFAADLGRHTARTDADGVASWDAIQPGLYDLSSTAPGLTATKKLIEVNEEGEAELILARTRELNVRVHYRGNPTPSRVWALSERNDYLPLRVNGSTVAWPIGLDWGYVRAEGYATSYFRVDPTTSDLLIELVPGVPIVVDLRDDVDRPLGHHPFTIEALGFPEGLGELHTNSRGERQLTLPPGTVRVRSTMPHGRAVEKTVELLLGRDTTITLP